MAKVTDQNENTQPVQEGGGEVCPRCKGAGEYEGFARHASGDPQDEYAATVQCEPCEGTGEVAAPPSAPVGASKVAVPADVLEARAQGRSEALAIVLRLDAEEGLDEYTQSIPPGPAGEWGTAWDEAKLRELFRADDTAWSLLQEAEGEYWHNLGLREEAQRLTQQPAQAAPGDDKLLWGVVANAGRLSPTRQQRWAHVMDATGQGSQSSIALCRRFGFDPDETVGVEEDTPPGDDAAGGGQ